MVKYHSATGNLLPSLHVLVVSISNEPSFMSNIPKTGQFAWAVSEYKDGNKHKPIYLVVFIVSAPVVEHCLEQYIVTVTLMNVYILVFQCLYPPKVQTHLNCLVVC